MAVASVVPEAIARFLDEPTPREWLDEACSRLPEMLLDHANCELKAASTALGFLYRYPERTALAQRMSKLAREELRHFEQVRSIMDEMEIPFQRLSASRYAGRLRDVARPMELRDARAKAAGETGQVLRRFTGVRGAPFRTLHCVCPVGVRY